MSYSPLLCPLAPCSHPGGRHKRMLAGLSCLCRGLSHQEPLHFLAFLATFFARTVDKEKIGLPLCICLCICDRSLAKWKDRCADDRLIASLRDGSKEQAGSKVKHVALRSTTAYLSFSATVECSPHTPLCDPPSPPGKALKVDLRLRGCRKCKNYL